MCGRYLFSLKSEDRASLRLLALFTAQFPEDVPPDGEIFPGMMVPILVSGGKRLQMIQARWGYQTRSKQLINARWETFEEKPTFREGMRCVVPTAGFYEWSTERKKYLFQGQTPLLYLAGICRREADEMKFVILTCPANGEVRGVHHRMPVILPQNALLRWVSGATPQELQEISAIPLQKQIIDS